MIESNDIGRPSEFTDEILVKAETYLTNHEAEGDPNMTTVKRKMKRLMSVC